MIESPGPAATRRNTLGFPCVRPAEAARTHSLVLWWNWCQITASEPSLAQWGVTGTVAILAARRNEETNACRRSKSRNCAPQDYIDSGVSYHMKAPRPKTSSRCTKRRDETEKTPNPVVIQDLSLTMLAAIRFPFEEGDIPIAWMKNACSAIPGDISICVPCGYPLGQTATWWC